jgi:hypothetical protein
MLSGLKMEIFFLALVVTKTLTLYHIHKLIFYNFIAFLTTGVILSKYTWST